MSSAGHVGIPAVHRAEEQSRSLAITRRHAAFPVDLIEADVDLACATGPPLLRHAPLLPRTDVKRHCNEGGAILVDTKIQLMNQADKSISQCSLNTARTSVSPFVDALLR